MREIKFRAWIKRYQKYMPVSLIDFYPNNGKIVSIEVVATGGDWCKFYPEEFILVQYTGLKDKNGKEIYEGDIMRFDAISYEIYWSDDFSGWHNRRTDGGERIYGSNSFEEVTRFGSVIGNIHENPELLEGEEK